MPDDNNDGLMGVAGDEQQTTTSTEQEAASEPRDDGKPTRPDWAPEQFWNAEKNELNGEKLAKSYNDLRAEFNKGRKGLGKTPDSPDGYLEDFKIERERGEGDDKKTLERIREVAGDDPALLAFAEVAHKNGLTDKQFKSLVSDAMFAFDGLMPEPFDLDREIEALGMPTIDDAKNLIATNKNWLDRMHADGTLNEDQYLAARQMGMSALGLQTLNALREQAGEKPIPTNTMRSNGGMKTRAELAEMMKDPRYSEDSPIGEQYRDEVSRGFVALTGGQ